MDRFENVLLLILGIYVFAQLIIYLLYKWLRHVDILMSSGKYNMNSLRARFALRLMDSKFFNECIDEAKATLFGVALIVFSIILFGILANSPSY